MLGRAIARTPQPGDATPVVFAPAASSRDARQGARLKILHAAGGPVACAVTAEAISHGPPPKVAGLVLAGFAIAHVLRRPLDRHAAQLPLMRHLGALCGAVLAGLLLVASDVTATGLWLAPAMVALCAASVSGSVLARRPLVRARKEGRAMRRVAVIGPDRVAAAVAEELADAPERGYTLVGRITPGELTVLPRIVAERGIDLLIIAPGTLTPSVLEEVTHSCLDLPVRLVELTGFCEEAFGHVPVSRDQRLVVPVPRCTRSSGARAPPLKRALDLVVAGIAGFASPRR